MSAKPIELPHSFELFIPTQCRCGQPLPAAEREDLFAQAKQKMLSWFGGANLRNEPIRGLWPLKSGELAEELNDVICSYATEQAFEEHREDFVSYAAELANRLTQEGILCRVNGKTLIYPSTQDPKPHRCALGTAPATAPQPLTPNDLARAKVLQASLQRIENVKDARDLFCNVLHYEYADEILPTRDWPDSAKQCLAPGFTPRIIANQNGFKIIYLQLAEDRLRKAHERQLVQRMLKDIPDLRGLVVVSDVTQKQWNLINAKFSSAKKSQDGLLLRRMRVGRDQLVRTAVERLLDVDVEKLNEKATAAQLQDAHDRAFDVEAVTKAFYSDIANWYFWALKHSKFPKDAPKEADGLDHISLIRLITRLIFCWFMREKGLVPDPLFDRRRLQELLVGFAPEKASNKDSVYYRAVLQNLFFATLNTEMDKRAWVKDDQHFMTHSLYRFKESFSKPGTAMDLFRSIPFLNGGLFECLDRDLGDGAKPRYQRIDGFSRRADSQPSVPDFLFFGPERDVDLSKEYDDKKFKSVTVRGLIDTLRRYNFTIEENTPIEQEVALDPELCGKVFENLLAAYNPETGATARKQTGSFYTRREIVNYMVDEALIASLKTKLEAALPAAKEVEARLRQLFSYDEPDNPFLPAETGALIAVIDSLKTLDPAVGSGAFPMGLLHKLVFILGKLDPDNAKWQERQRQRAVQETEETFKIGAKEQRESRLKDINEVFDHNKSDYGRKLYLIENCIYGVDIQPIAVQIAKMRFFISLMVDQNINPQADNRGVRPLPNLETKFVAANTLVRVERPDSQTKLFSDPKLSELMRKLADIRHRIFTARTSSTKQRLRETDDEIRGEMAVLLKTAFVQAAWDEGEKTRNELAKAQADLDAEKTGPPQWHIIRNPNLFGEIEEKKVDPSRERKQRLANQIKELEGRLHRAKQVVKEVDAVAKQLAGWDPYDQNKHANFFDPEWMFGLVEGFTLVIGNPPYVLLQNSRIPEEERQYLNCKYSAAQYKVDLYHLFIEAGVNLLHATGVLAYITPNTFLKNKHNNKLREILATKTRILSIALFYCRVFEDPAVDNLVFICQRARSLADAESNRIIIHKIYEGDLVEQLRNESTFQQGGIKAPDYSFELDITADTTAILSRMEIGSLPFGKIGGSYFGIQTFNREAFVASVKLNQFYRPIIDGGNVFPYFTSEPVEHVDFRPQNIKSGGDPKIYSKHRIVVRQIGRFPEGAICPKGVLTLNTIYNLYLNDSSFDLRYILALINSRLIHFYWLQRFYDNKKTFPKIKKKPLHSIPIKKCHDSITNEIIEQVDRIIALKRKHPDADTAALEREIDRRVYSLYGLSEDEIKIVEKATAKE